MSDSYARGDTSAPLLDETIGANLDRAVARFGERDALISCAQGRRYSYAELGAAVDELARALIAAGLEKARPDRDLEPQLRGVDAGPVRHRQARRHPGQRQPGLPDLGARVRPAPVGLPHARRRLRVQDLRLPGDDRGGPPGAAPSSSGWCSWTRPTGTSFWPAPARSRRSELRARADGLAPDDPINIQYTSGTTGFPKGATLTHRNILNNGYFVGEGCRYTEEDRVCIPVPFYHCFGMVMGNLGATTHGAAMVIPAPAFDPEATLQACAQERCTSLYGVPTMFIAQLDHPRFADYDLSSLRTGIMAGSPCPVEVMKRVMDLMHMSEVGICYGMTETSPVSTQTAHDDPVEQAGRLGRARPPPRRDQDRRPRGRRHRGPRGARASCARAATA